MFWTSRTSCVAAAHLEQRVVARRARVGRIEQQAVREARAPAGGQLPVLALDVVDDRRAWPGQQRRHDQADALAASGSARSQAHARGRHGAGSGRRAGRGTRRRRRSRPARSTSALGRPARRAVGGDVLRLARAPAPTGDRGGDRSEPARGGDDGALVEDRGRIGVVVVPPAERRPAADRSASREASSRRAERWLKAEAPCGPLGRGPDESERDAGDDDDLAPEDAGCGRRKIGPGHTGSGRSEHSGLQGAQESGRTFDGRVAQIGGLRSPDRACARDSSRCATVLHGSGDSGTEVALEHRRPGDERKAAAVVDHGEPAGGEVQPLPVDAGDGLATRRPARCEAGLVLEPSSCRLELPRAQRRQQVAGEDDPLA